MYTIFRSKSFNKSYRRLKRSGFFKASVQETLEDAITMLANGQTLPAYFMDHQLKGEFAAYREFHVKGNLLVMYRTDENLHVIALMDIGTHPQLFG